MIQTGKFKCIAISVFVMATEPPYHAFSPNHIFSQDYVIDIWKRCIELFIISESSHNKTTKIMNDSLFLSIYYSFVYLNADLTTEQLFSSIKPNYSLFKPILFYHTHGAVFANNGLT